MFDFFNIDKSKSNLKIKQHKRKNQKKRSIQTTRKKQQKQKLQNINIIFGLDNGSSGTIACIIPKINKIFFQKTPAFETLDYTKQIQYISRINHFQLKKWFEKCIFFLKNVYKNDIKVIVILQRPMVNPQRFKQSKSALRAYEATLIVLQLLNLDYIVIDSKQWQHYFFGKNTSQIDLKFESMKKGIEILQQYNLIQEQKNIMQELMKKHGDADSLLMCEFAKRSLIKGVMN